jgi:hypothetical protein
MTLDAEPHLKSFPRETVHGLNLSVTFPALDLLFNVPLMIKQNVFG